MTLFLFGDIQYDNQNGFAKEAWEQFKSDFKKTPNAWALGLGDYNDFVRPTIQVIRRTRFYERQMYWYSYRASYLGAIRGWQY